MRDDLIKAIHDPAGLVRVAMDTLEASWEGKINIPDASNPFMHNLEFAAVLASTVNKLSNSKLQKQYPALANTYSDLYHHMTDMDYLGVFGTPSSCNFSFFFKKQTIINKAVEIPGTKTRKLTIPRNTIVVINGIEFTLLYPIDILVMSHGGIRIVYNNDVTTDLQVLTSNSIPWVSGISGGVELLQFEVPLYQIKRRRLSGNLNPATGFKVEYEIVDQFYYARVYGRRSDGTVFEYRTTYSEEVYDRRYPTAIIRQIEKGISVEIPLIYITSGITGTTVETEIYTTKGPLKMDMATYLPDSFGLRLGEDYNVPSDSIYTSPMTSIDTYGVMSKSMTVGGSNGLTFQELRERNMSTAYTGEIPITDVQLADTVKRSGFDLLKSVIDLRERTYLATRPLPSDLAGRFSTGMASAMMTVETDLESLSGSVHISDNGDRVTLLPSTLYRIDNGNVTIVPDTDRPEVITEDPASLSNVLNSAQYAYTPFHYVLDASELDFQIRPYYLAEPEILSKSFINENDTAQLSVSTIQHSIEKTVSGYRLLINSKVGVTYKALDKDLLFLQLAFLPYREKELAYLNGTLLGEHEGMYIWEFILDSSFDVDNLHNLMLNNFSIYSGLDVPYGTSMESEFTLIYSVANYTTPGLLPSDIDKLLGEHLLPNNITAITAETLTLHLGDSLAALWANTRPVLGTLEYRRYTEDVPKVYLADEYLEDAQGHLVLEEVSGKLEPTILHSEGDPVLVDGVPQFSHFAGDVMYDELTNQPLYVNDVRKIRHRMDLFLLDGVYAYADDVSDVSYRNEVPKSIVSYVNDLLGPLTRKTLGGTNLYFYPKATLSNTKVTVGEGKVVVLGNDNGFVVTYGLTGTNYRDGTLRASIETITAEVLGTALQLPRVTISGIMADLKENIGADVESIDITKFGAKSDISAFTYLDNSSRINVRRVLRALPNNRLTVVEDISVRFIEL